MKARILGVLLATRSPGDLALVMRLSRAALELGCDVRVFVMHEGVHALCELSHLAEEGADVTVCETDLERHDLMRPDAVMGGSQYDHARIVFACDRFIAFA